MVSIIIPTYKRANCIERAINSILCQTYKDYEIIVVDDNNPNTIDRSNLEKKMEKYENNSKIIYVQHEKNMNGAAARNTGISIAKGEYITFLDDDDFFLKNRLEVMVKYLNSNNDYDAAYSSSITKKNNKIVEVNYATHSGDLQFEMLCQNTLYRTGSNLFFRAKALKDINGFDASFLRHQDVETMVRFFRKFKIMAVNDILVVKVADDSMNPNIKKAIEFKKYFLDKFKDDINKYDNVEKIYYTNYSNLMKIAIECKDFNAYKELKEEMKTYSSIDFKLIIKNCIFLLNNLIPIKDTFHKIFDRKAKKNLDTNILEEINKIESLDN